MNLLERIDHNLGFPNDEIVVEAYKKGIDTFSDIHLCKIGLFAAMSDNEDFVEKKAKSIMNKLRAKHDKSGPFMLLKWITQISSGRKEADNLISQIQDWANNHPDDLFYSRALLWLHSKVKDPIEVIGLYVKHLELHWKDDLTWERLGLLYMKENKFEMAAFAFEEAVGLAPNIAHYYREAAKARLAITDEAAREKNVDVARKQLCKAVMLVQTDQESWNLLIEHTDDAEKREKFSRYRNKVIKTTKDE